MIGWQLKRLTVLVDREQRPALIEDVSESFPIPQSLVSTQESIRRFSVQISKLHSVIQTSSIKCIYSRDPSAEV